VVAALPILFFLWAAALDAAAPAVPAAPPPETLARLRAAARRRDVVVWSGERRYRLSRPQFDSTGVWSRDASVYRAPRPAVIAMSDAPRRVMPPRPIAWAIVDSIATVTEPNGPVVAFAALSILGALAGAVVAGISLATHSSSTPNGVLVARIAVPAAVALGLSVSAAARSRLTTVYRSAQP
jgi:hypothetical protein